MQFSFSELTDILSSLTSHNSILFACKCTPCCLFHDHYSLLEHRSSSFLGKITASLLHHRLFSRSASELPLFCVWRPFLIRSCAYRHAIRHGFLHCPTCLHLQHRGQSRSRRRLLLHQSRLLLRVPAPPYPVPTRRIKRRRSAGGK